MRARRVLVVGGNGGTGREVVRQAAAAGYEVTCLSRRGADALPEGVRNLIGDALDPSVSSAAVAGMDAVVVTVGGAAGSQLHRTRITEAIISAMQSAGVRRLIVQSSLGVGDSIKLMPAALRLFARTVLGAALADHAAQEAVVAASGLDWTVVRPGGLTDGPASGRYVAQQTAAGLPMKGRIARADVAAHVVAIIEDGSTFGQALAMGTP